MARWVREALEMLAVPAALKTSGSSGLHIYIPLAEGTTYESGQLLCQIIATAVASQHPRVATVERAVAKTLTAFARIRRRTWRQHACLTGRTGSCRRSLHWRPSHARRTMVTA